MSPSPAERFSALLARSGERGWSPHDDDAHDDADVDPDEGDDVAVDDGRARGARPGITRTVVLVAMGLVLAAVLVLVLAPSLLRGPGDPVTAADEWPARGEPAESTAEPDVSPGVATSGSVVVHVVGAVAVPGVVELPAGSRVADALDAAGGPEADAEIDGVNLARALVDGEQLRVPRVGEEPDRAPAGSGAVPEGGLDAGGADGGETGALVDLNTADLETLQTLQGIGPVTAQAILDHREAIGRFRSVDELLDVTGIGDATLASVRDSVTVG